MVKIYFAKKERKINKNYHVLKFYTYKKTPG